MAVYEVAPLFRVSVSCIYKALGRHRMTGETVARPQWRRPGQRLAALHDASGASLTEAIRTPKRASGIVAGWVEQKVTREISNAFGAV